MEYMKTHATSSVCFTYAGLVNQPCQISGGGYQARKPYSTEHAYLGQVFFSTRTYSLRVGWNKTVGGLRSETHNRMI